VVNYKKSAFIRVPNQRLSASTNKKSAQDIQDDIFRKMSADKKIELWSKFWQLARDLAGSKEEWFEKLGVSEILNGQLK